LLILTAAASTAAARERYSMLPKHLPVATEVCFGRAYDPAHFARHPKQRVTSFHLFRDFAADLGMEREVETAEELRQQDGLDGAMRVTAYVRFRDRPGVFWSNLGCHKSDVGGLYCSIDCDGGSFALRTRGDALLLENNGFVVVGGCGATEDEEAKADYVKPGADDKLFRLDRKGLAECTTIRDSLKPKWAALGRPVRERLGRAEPVCFARSYDATYLAAHPQQKVRRIAVFKPESGEKDKESWPSHKLTFRVELADGRKLEQWTYCNPEDYAYSCPHRAEHDTQRDFYLTRAGSDHIMLRDPRAKLEKMFEVELGADDRLFKLQTAPASACKF
jgi:hypothetical protein